MATIGQWIVSAFNVARRTNIEEVEEWISISFHIGGLLPSSLLASSVQRCGELDALLLSLEDETSKEPVEAGGALFKFHYQAMLSELWVGSLYEICRLLKERGLIADNVALLELAHDLRLIRIPLEKHEIAADNKLPAELQMQRCPPVGSLGDAFAYHKNDKAKKTHIIPSGLTERGSLTWQVIDTQGDAARWIERRNLSERFRSAAKSPPAPMPERRSLG